jgi:hypothetical protein
MEQHEFDIAIGPDGKVTIEVKGVKGQGCLGYAKFFEEVLGKIVATERTAEFYAPPTGVAIHIQQKEKAR